MSRVFDLLAEEVLKLSDSEIEKEYLEDGEKLYEVADKMRQGFQKAIDAFWDSRLQKLAKTWRDSLLAFALGGHRLVRF